MDREDELQGIIDFQTKEIEELKIENKRLREALGPAEKAIISLHCNYENTRAPHDGRVSGCELCANLEIIQKILKE